MKTHRALFLLISTIPITLGLVFLSMSSGMQIRVAQLSAWVRGSIDPVGALPATRQPSAEPARFWLPDLIPPVADTSVAGMISDNSTQPIPLPVSVQLTAPHFDPLHDYQDWNNCGPATLALYLRYWGWQGDQYEISKVIRPNRQDKNVSIDELVIFVEGLKNGLGAVTRVGGDATLLKQLLAAGFPVLIEKSFHMEKAAWAGDDLWAGHYLLVTGYEDTHRNFTVQDSYHGPNLVIASAALMEDWQSFNHAYLVLFPQEQEQEVAAVLSADWGVASNRLRTISNLQVQVKTDPGNRWAWFNLGSSLAENGEFAAAAKALKIARQLGLPQRMLRYQFAPFEVAHQTGDSEDLSALVAYALQVTPDSEEALYWRGWLDILQGNRDEGIRQFKKLLKAHPNFTQAKEALNKLSV